MCQLPDFEKIEYDLPFLLKALRIELFSKQKDVAKSFYLHPSKISHWENDSEKPPFGYVISLIIRFTELEGTDSNTQLQSLEYSNKVINSHYLGGKLFHSWDELCQVANNYYKKRYDAHQRKKAPPDLFMFALNNPLTWSFAVDLLVKLIPEMEKVGYREKLIPPLKKGIQQCKNNNDYKAITKLYLYLGKLYQLQGKYDEAKKSIDNGYKYAKELNNSCMQAEALNQLAFIAYRKCRFQDGIDLIKSSLELSKEDSQERIFSDYVLGIITLKQRNWEEADVLLQKAFNSWEQYNNQWMMGRTLTFRGSALRQMKNYQEAINIYNQAISFLTEVGDTSHAAMAEMNLGNIFYQQNQFKEALKKHLRAKQKFQETKDVLHKAHVLHNIAMARRKLKQLGQAEIDCRNSKKLWEQFGDIEQLVNTMAEMGWIYKDKGSYEEAKVEFEEAINRLEEIKDKPVYKQKLKKLGLALNEINKIIEELEI